MARGPALACTKIELRVGIAILLDYLGRYEEAIADTEAALAAMEVGDEYLGRSFRDHASILQHIRIMGYAHTARRADAIRLAEAIVADETHTMRLRLDLHMRLAVWYAAEGNAQSAQDWYNRLKGFAPADEATQKYLQYLIATAERLTQPSAASVQAAASGTTVTIKSACCGG